MATTKRDFYIVDLIRNRKEFVNLEVPAIRVNISIVVEADVPKSKMDRLEKAARDSIDKTEDIVTEILRKHEQKCAEFVAQRKWKEAMTAAEQVAPLINKAAVVAQSNADKAVEDTKKKEAQGDKLLTEARVKTTVTFIFGGIKVATSVTRIAVSHGGDVHAWYSLVKELYAIGTEIQQQLKDEPQLRKDLANGLKIYIEFRATVVVQAATAQGLTDTSNLPGFPQVIKALADRVVLAAKTAKDGVKDKDAGTVFKEIGAFIVKGVTAHYNDVEKARQKYREQTTKMRQKVDAVSAKGDKLFAEMKKQTTLKDGVKIGAQCMQVRGKATALAKLLEDAVSFLDETQTTLQGYGLKCDDSTILQKISALSVTTIFTEGAGIVQNIKAVYDLGTTIASAVG
jgi:hypothetical protein